MKELLKALAIAGVCLGVVLGCGGRRDVENADQEGNGGGGNGGAESALTGAVKGDGSSTVFPIMEAVAE